MTIRSLVGLFALATMVAGEAMNLGKSDFNEHVFDSGKNAFVKFLAPWCGHCKKMKPDWDKLGSTYEGSSSVVIADVDCTVEKDLCSEFGVSGYPTIKYYTADTGKEGAAYNGGRSYEALETFVEENLQVKCSVAERDGCNDKENKFIDAMAAKGAADVQKQIDRLDGMKDKKMKPALAGWLKTRLRLLKELAGGGGEAEKEDL